MSFGTWVSTQWSSFTSSNYALFIVLWIISIIFIVTIALLCTSLSYCTCISCVLHWKRREWVLRRTFRREIRKLREKRFRDILCFNVDGTVNYEVSGRDVSMLKEEKNALREQRKGAVVSAALGKYLTLLDMWEIRKENHEKLRHALRERQRNNPHLVGAPVLSFLDDDDDNNIETPLNESYRRASTVHLEDISTWAPLHSSTTGTPAETPVLGTFPSFTPISPVIGNDDPFLLSSDMHRDDMNPWKDSHQPNTTPSEHNSSLRLISQINKRLRRLYAMNSRILFYEALNHTHGKLNFPSQLPRGHICIVALLIDSIDALWEKQDTQIMMKTLDMFADVLVHEMNQYAGQMAQMHADVFYLAFHEPFDALQFCISLQKSLLRVPWSYEFLHRCTEVKPDFDEANHELIHRGIRLKCCLDMCNVTQVERDIERHRDLYPLDALGRVTTLIAKYAIGGDILATPECWKAIQTSIQFAEKQNSEGLYVEERQFVSSSSPRRRSVAPTSAWLILPKSLRGRASLPQRFISSFGNVALKSIELKYQQVELEDLITDLKHMYTEKVGTLHITSDNDATNRHDQEQQTDVDPSEDEYSSLHRQLALLETQIHTYDQVASRSLNHTSFSKPPSPSSSIGDSKLFFVQIDIPNVRLLWKECDSRGMISPFIQSIQTYFHCIRAALERSKGYEFAVNESRYYCCFNDAHEAIEFVLNVQMDLLEVEWDQQLVNHVDAMRVESLRDEVAYHGLRARAAVHVALRTLGIDFASGGAPVLNKSMQETLQDLITHTIGGETALSHDTWLFVKEYDAVNDFTHGMYAVQEEGGELWFIVPHPLSARLRNQTTKTVTVVENETSLIEERDSVLAKLSLLENRVETLEVKQLTLERDELLRRIEFNDSMVIISKSDVSTSTDTVPTTHALLQTDPLSSLKEVAELQEKIEQMISVRRSHKDRIEEQNLALKQVRDELKTQGAQIEQLRREKLELLEQHELETQEWKNRLVLAATSFETSKKFLEDRIEALQKVNDGLSKPSSAPVGSAYIAPVEPPLPRQDRDNNQALHEQIARQKAQLDQQQQALTKLKKSTEHKLQETEKSYKEHLESMMHSYTQKIQSLIAERQSSLYATPRMKNSVQDASHLQLTSSKGPITPSAALQSPFIFFNLPPTPDHLRDEPSVSIIEQPQNASVEDHSGTFTLSTTAQSFKSLKPIMVLWNVFLVHLSELLAPTPGSLPDWDYSFLSTHGTLIYAGDEFKYLSERRLHTHSYQQWLHRYFILGNKTKMPSQPLLRHGLAVFHPALLPFAHKQSTNTVLKRDARSVQEWWKCIHDQGELWTHLIHEERVKCLQSLSYPLHLRQNSTLLPLAESLFARSLLYLDTISLHKLSLTCRAFWRQISSILDICCVAVLEPFDLEGDAEQSEDRWNGRWSYR